MEEVTLRDIYNAVDSLRQEIKRNYVSRKEFFPVQAIVYGMVGLILTTVFVAILAKVVIAVA